MEFITAYGPKMGVTVDASVPVMTKQSFKNSTDINKIVGKFVKAGMTPQLPADTTFGFAPPYTFHEALELIRTADDYFEKLPAEARTKFDNDPGEFLAFVEDPENIPELAKMGLIDAREAPVEPPEPAPEREPEP